MKCIVNINALGSPTFSPANLEIDMMIITMPQIEEIIFVIVLNSTCMFFCFAKKKKYKY